MSFPAHAEAVKSLAEIRRFIELSTSKTEAVKELLAHPNADSAAFKWASATAEFTLGRTYDYICATVLLYGLFERFIENISSEYVDSLTSKSKNYEELPEKLRASHFEFSVLQLQRTMDSRYDGKTTAAELAKSLAGCLNGTSPYRLIAESLKHHTANFRPPVVDEYLARLGVSGVSNACILRPPFTEYLALNNLSIPPERPVAVLDRVNDLITRRNEVAHGDHTNALGPTELVPYCDQVEAYCASIHDVLYDSYVLYAADLIGINHGHPIDVFNNNIVCLNSKGADIRRGTRIIIRQSDNSISHAEVIGLQINGAAVLKTPEGVDIAVGLEISSRCKKKYTVSSINP